VVVNEARNTGAIGYEVKVDEINVKRSKRMLLVLDMAKRAEDGAAQALEQARQASQQTEQQLQQIEKYQLDYQTQLNQPKAGVSVQALMNDRQFLAQLMGVVETQKAQLQQLRDNESNVLRNWQLCYQRRKNIEKMIAGLKSEEDAQFEKQLQKEMDELSMIAARTQI
tara:strand:- start:14105 stop:14608 length:504 start_codon:yes stop_codon:yes gene_type:complete